MRAIEILGATLLAGIAVIGVLWYLRRRRLAAAKSAEEKPAGAAPALGAALLPAKAPSKADGPEPADLNRMLTRLERAIRERVPRRIDFRLSLLPDLWRCRSDLDALRPVLLALVSGAVGELKSSGTLIVGTRNFVLDPALAAEIPDAAAGEFARLTVRDNGPGFSEDALARMLDPAATPRPSVAGAAAAVRGFGGFVRVESAEGVGTAVHLYFARAVEEGEAAAEPGTTAAAAE